MENKEIKVRPFFVKCVIIEAITVGLIVITVFAMSLISKSYKKRLKAFYDTYVREGHRVHLTPILGINFGGRG